MKTRVLLLVGAFCAALLTQTGCSDPPEADAPAVQGPAPIEIDPTRETPEACYAAFRGAWNSRDFDEAFDYLSPRGEEFVGASYVVMIGLWQGMGTREMHESPFGQALEQLLDDRAIENLGWRMKHHLGDDERDDDDRHVPALLATGRDLGDPLVFTEALYAIDVEHNANGRLEFFEEGLSYGSVSDIEVIGDKAMGWFGSPRMTVELSVEFIRTEEGWLIDMIYPGPLEEPGGNQIRERQDGA